MRQTSAKIAKPKKRREEDEFPLDRFSEKPRRGRPPKIPASWVRGRADNHRVVLAQIWQHIWPGLSKAVTRQDVVNTLNGAKVSTAYALDFITLADSIFKVIKDPKFPKRKQEARINFLADSIAGYGTFTPRSSRDICERERARINRVHRILAYEYYVRCSCGYEGPSRNHACPKCEAEIQFPPIDSPFDTEF
jgi:hypothetical protein